MEKRKFNKKAYDKVDMPAKLKLQKIVEKHTKFRLVGSIDEELYKDGDLVFSDGENTIIYENEVRDVFDTIVNEFETIHIPIRKDKTITKIDYYVVWKQDFSQFILIPKESLIKFKDNIEKDVPCNHEMGEEVSCLEDFIHIVKENYTQWYVIGQNLNLHKMNYK